MSSVRFSFCSYTALASGSAGHMDSQSSKQCGAMPRGRRNIRFNGIRAVQVSGVEPQAVQAAESGGHMKKSGTLYEVLGVSKGASAQDIKSAYRKLARQFHPDAAASPQAKSTNTQMFLQIHNAYAVLSKPEERVQYDRQLVMQQSQRWKKAPSGGTYPYRSGHKGQNWETDQCW